MPRSKHKKVKKTWEDVYLAYKDKGFDAIDASLRANEWAKKKKTIRFLERLRDKIEERN